MLQMCVCLCGFLIDRDRDSPDTEISETHEVCRDVNVLIEIKRIKNACRKLPGKQMITDETGFFYIFFLIIAGILIILRMIERLMMNLTWKEMALKILCIWGFHEKQMYVNVLAGFWK